MPSASRRWRLKTPRALVQGRDGLADNMSKVVERVQKDLEDRGWRSEKMARIAEKWVPILTKTLDELRGEGGHPDLLAAIYDA